MSWVFYSVGRLLKRMVWSAPISLQMVRTRRRALNKFKQRGVAFIHITRTGGTSVCKLLYGCNTGHAVFAADKFPDIPCFAVVRDPIDRFLSSYFFLSQGGTEIMPLRIQAMAVGFFSCNFVAKHIKLFSLLDACLWPQKKWTNIEGLKLVRYEDLSLISDLEVTNSATRIQVTLSDEALAAIRTFYAEDYLLREGLMPSESVCNAKVLSNFLRVE